MALVRFALIGGALALGYSGLLFHLYTVQIENGATHYAKAASQIAGDRTELRRGEIFFTDRVGTKIPAASVQAFPEAYAVPKVIDDAKETAGRVADILGLDAGSLTKRFGNKTDEYELLKRKLEPEEARMLQEAQIPGVYLTETKERVYPFGTLAAHLLGFLAPDDTKKGTVGKYGVEEYKDEALSSEENIVLTIDPSVQKEAERILEETITKHKATGGSVIVENPKTGKILAMVSYPTFDPNAYSGSAVASFLNPVTQSIYEPGSVMKVVTMASALDAGAVTPDTAFEDTGSLKVSGREIKNWDLRAHGHVTMTNVIEQSLNTGAAFAERKLGNDAFTKYMNAFGLGEKTGIELPNEVKGDLKRLTPKSPEVAFATASFGQGVAVTPLAMLQAVATLANKGVRLIPSIDAKQKPQEEGRIVSTKAAEQITAMMVSAVDKAEVGAIKGYGLAGKTGTAQVPDFKNGGYSKDVEHTYIGFGPAKDPQFIILLKIDKPAGAPLAGTTVVPAFRSLAQFLISYYNIPPDRLPQ